LRDAAHLLMEGTPDGTNHSEVAAALRQIEGVTNVHHIHAWALTRGRQVFSAHLGISEQADQQGVLEKAHELVTTPFGFFFGTLQLETRCLDESAARDIDIDLGTENADVAQSDHATKQHSGHSH
jgi:cobalt-zinc-cadmium efflux system protein